MPSLVWFGPDRAGRWIPAPLKGAENGGQGNLTATTFASGGVRVQKSGRARTHSMSWIGDSADLLTVRSLFEGHYGPAPYYYCDPLISNVAPPVYAAPALRAQGWPRIFSEAAEMQRPSVYSTGSTTRAPQGISQTFRVGEDMVATAPVLTLAIPPGYWLHVWAFFNGGQGGLTMKATPYSGADPVLNYNDAAATVPTPYRIFDGTKYPSVQLSFYLTGTNASARTFIYEGMVAKLFKTGTAQSAQLWTPGEGATGYDLAEVPSSSSYFAPGGKVTTNLSAKLVEVLPTPR